MADIKNVLLGTNQVSKIYSGDDLIFEAPVIDTTAPVTTLYPDPTDPNLTHYAGTKVWFEVNEMCDTYYTLDGTTPTTASTLFTEPFTLNETTTIKYFSVDTKGNQEAVKTTIFDIYVEPTGIRYVRFIGHGDQTGITTRLVELEAIESGTNRLLGKTPISGETPNGGNIAYVTNGTVVHGSSDMVYWWIAEGIPDLVYDLGAVYPIESIRVVMYSPSSDPRTTQFRLLTSTDNATWDVVADYTTNATMQPETGFTFTI